ncbi:MAG: hypothetical protein AAF434_08410 [Pseudomonadota bacterium]
MDFFQDFNDPSAGFSTSNREDFDHGYLEDLEIPSGIKSDNASNDLIRCKHVRARADEPRYLFFITGWRRQNTDVEVGICKFFAKFGISSVLMSPPYSQKRTPPGWWSGEYFVSGDIYLTVSNFRQCVSDAVGVLNWIANQKPRKIGLFGFSLGGVLLQLVSNVYPVDNLFLVVSGARLGDLVWYGKLTQELRQDIESAGINRRELNLAWSICDPETVGHHCQVTKENVLIYSSLYDEVVLPEYQDALWQSLGQPERIQLPCAHYSVFFYLKSINTHVANVFLEK